MKKQIELLGKDRVSDRTAAVERASGRKKQRRIPNQKPSATDAKMNKKGVKRTSHVSTGEKRNGRTGIGRKGGRKSSKTANLAQKNSTRRKKKIKFLDRTMKQKFPLRGGGGEE